MPRTSRSNISESEVTREASMNVHMGSPASSQSLAPCHSVMITLSSESMEPAATSPSVMAKYELPTLPQMD